MGGVGGRGLQIKGLVGWVERVWPVRIENIFIN
jgi:hypothetical protein